MHRLVIACVLASALSHSAQPYCISLILLHLSLLLVCGEGKRAALCDFGKLDGRVLPPSPENFDLLHGNGLRRSLSLQSPGQGGISTEDGTTNGRRPIDRDHNMELLGSCLYNTSYGLLVVVLAGLITAWAVLPLQFGQVLYLKDDVDSDGEEW